MNSRVKESVKLRALLVAVLGLYDHIYLLLRKGENKNVRYTILV